MCLVWRAQGFWPDGLYTAPSDAALLADIEMARSLNLTTLRKHIKVEPDRWYYHADRCAHALPPLTLIRTARVGGHCGRGSSHAHHHKRRPCSQPLFFMCRALVPCVIHS